MSKGQRKNLQLQIPSSKCLKKRKVRDRSQEETCLTFSAVEGKAKTRPSWSLTLRKIVSDRLENFYLILKP